MPAAEKSINALFGERLGKFKERAHISIAKISYATSISVNYITDTINGKRNPTLSHIESYANLFGIPAFELLNFDAPVPARCNCRLTRYFWILPVPVSLF